MERGNSTYGNVFLTSQGIVSAVIATPGILGNIFAFFLTLRLLRHQKIVCNVLVFGLILSDLLGIILICSPTWASYVYGQWSAGQPLCDFQGFFAVFSTLAYGLIVTFMAIDRYLALRASFFHRQFISFRLAKKIIVGIALFSIVISSLPLFGFGSFSFSSSRTYCTIIVLKAHDKLYNYFLVSIGFFMVSIVTFSNLNVLHWFLKQKKSARNLKGMKSKFKKVNKTKKTAAEKVQEQYQRMMVVISILFLICWTPFLIRVICNTADIWQNVKADIAATYLMLVKFVVDPFVYLFISKQHRRTFFKICCWCLPCIKKERRQSIKVRFAYSASLKNSEPAANDQIQTTENKSHALRPREERSSIPKIMAHDVSCIDDPPTTATEALVHPNITKINETKDTEQHISVIQELNTETSTDADKQIEKEGNSNFARMETARDDKKIFPGTLRDKQGILPTITVEDVRDALRSLAQDPGFANEGMTDDVDSSQFNEIMQTLKDCFSGQRSRSHLRKPMSESNDSGTKDNDLLISLENDKSDVFTEGGKTDPAVGVRALQVMDIIQTKRRAKQIEKMV